MKYFFTFLKLIFQHMKSSVFIIMDGPWLIDKPANQNGQLIETAKVLTF